MRDGVFMRLFERFKMWFTVKPKVADQSHHVFGILHPEVCGDADDFWQAELLFDPLNVEICVNIKAGIEGPSEEQAEFFKRFEIEYLSRFESIYKPLKKEVENWIEHKLSGEFIVDFEFCGLTIPVSGNINNFWEMSFYCPAEGRDHIFTVELLNNKVKNIRADG